MSELHLPPTTGHTWVIQLLNVDLKRSRALVATDQARTVDIELNARRFLRVTSSEVRSIPRCQRSVDVQNELSWPLRIAFGLGWRRLLLCRAYGHLDEVFPVTGRQLGDRNT